MLRCLSLICLLFGLIGCEKPAEQATTDLGFFEAPFVHPALIEMFGGWMSDRDPNVMAFDLDEAQDSNQIARARDFEVSPNEVPGVAPWVQVSEAQSAIDGIIYLKCYSWGGGSGYWSHHMAVQIVNDTQIRCDENDLAYEHPYSMLKLVGHLPSDFFE